MTITKPNGVLAILIDNEIKYFEGCLFGYPVSLDLYQKRNEKDRDLGFGEVVFNTSMTGYQEILTDPSYYGQIMVMTTPHIGNTGVNQEDFESLHPWCAGFVIAELAVNPSSWRSEDQLHNYLREYKIPGIHSIDTRALTLALRTRGVVRGILLQKEDKQHARALLEELPKFDGRDLIGEVSTTENYRWERNKGTEKKHKIVAMDFGVKWNLLRHLEDRNCEIEVVSADTSAETILEMKPDGIFLSNGPGDPSAAPYAVETVKKLVGKVPMFGVCMGHQILALASGAKSYKLKFGHRGGNHPVKDLETGRVEISSQNHGYAIDPESLPSSVIVTHRNLNDGTIEGIRWDEKKAFSVQYHPEASPGPHDSTILFDRFIDLVQQSK